MVLNVHFVSERDQGGTLKPSIILAERKKRKEQFSKSSVVFLNFIVFVTPGRFI